jgi:hypothetical protein
VDPTLVRIVRWLEACPWNRSGTDKSWVLDAMWAALRFDREVAGAKRAPPR